MDFVSLYSDQFIVAIIIGALLLVARMNDGPAVWFEFIVVDGVCDHTDVIYHDYCGI